MCVDKRVCEYTPASTRAESPRASPTNNAPAPGSSFVPTRDRQAAVTPAGHLAAAVIAGDYFEYDRRAMTLCLAGAVVPDLVDKTVWRLGLAETGHTLAHSVVTLAVVAGVVAVVSTARHLRPVLPGYAAHVAADIGVAYPRFVVNYGWPLVEQRPTPDVSPVGYWIRYAMSAPGVAEIGIVVAGVVVVARRGRDNTDDEDSP